MTDSSRTESGKLPFTAPKLEIYGRARDITRNVGPRGISDNGGGGAAGPKTSA
jgi:hypothetical protein